jgi:hypothetical protein
LRAHIRELFSIVQDGLKADKHFLLEQAMGTFLDTDWGTYPFVTASTTIPSAASAGLGIPPRYITNVVGVTKPTPQSERGHCPEILDTKAPSMNSLAKWLHHGAHPPSGLAGPGSPKRNAGGGGEAKKMNPGPRYWL